MRGGDISWSNDFRKFVVKLIQTDLLVQKFSELLAC